LVLPSAFLQGAASDGVATAREMAAASITLKRIKTRILAQDG
jgi:hypothetical protein